MRNGGRAIAAGLLAACALGGFAFAFAVGATASSDTTLQSTPPTTTTTTEPPPTEPPTEPPPTEPTPPPPSPRQPGIPTGVTIGGVAVGGLMPYEAAEAVRTAFARPLLLVLGPGRRLQMGPDEVGARPNVRKAVSRARFSRPGTNVRLEVGVSRNRIRGYVDWLGHLVDRKPVDARLVLRGAGVRAVPGREGRRLQRLTGARAIRVSLKTNARDPIRLASTVLEPKTSEANLGPALVIMRDSKKLRYFVNAKLERTFGVATGQSAFPTPLGAYEIVVKQRDPWWYPPPSDWAAGQSPIPPGPGNPLGTRWMGLSAPYVGIHGTPDAASIGYSASHGCIRMRIPDAEWLFPRVELGTPVFIVPR